MFAWGRAVPAQPAKCACKTYGNQHGSYYRACEYHSKHIEEAAKSLQITPEEFVHYAIERYFAEEDEKHSIPRTDADRKAVWKALL